MEGFTNPSDADREFDELRRRAYGRDSDIGLDPPALARLRELEATHRADVNRRADTRSSESAPGPEATPTVTPTNMASLGDAAAPEPMRPAAPKPRSAAAPSPSVKDGASRTLSTLQRATAMGRSRLARTTWRSRLAWSAGALLIGGGIIATVLLVASPRPDATLHPTTGKADSEIRRMVNEEAPWFGIDTSTLRVYGVFHGLEIWSGLNAFDSPCLVAFHQATGGLSESSCAPTPADLIMDVSSSGDGFEGFDGLAGEGIIRFMLRGDTVDAYVHLLPEVD